MLLRLFWTLDIQSFRNDTAKFRKLDASEFSEWYRSVTGIKNGQIKKGNEIDIIQFVLFFNSISSKLQN